MKSIEIHDLLDFKVEDFAHFMIQKKGTFQSLKSKIHHSDLPEADTEKVMKHLEYAKERMEKPLDLGQTILFIIFPFGTVNKLYKNEFFDVGKEFKLGYAKKVKEFKLYSFLGIAFYFVLVLMIVFIT